MTKGQQTKGWAPYQPGDSLTLRHACGDPTQTHTAAVEVRRCESVQGHDIGSYKWRVVATRCDGTLVMVDVDHHGLDQHARVTPPAVVEAVQP